MKTTAMLTLTHLSPLASPIRSILWLAMFMITPLQALDLYWNKVGTDWANIENWSTVAGAPTPNPLSPPDGDDIVIFHTSGATTTQTVHLLGTQSALGIRTTSANTITTTIAGGGTHSILKLGTSGIVHLFGGLNIGLTTTGQEVDVHLQGSQTWNSSAASTGASAIMVRNKVTTDVAGTHLLTLTGINTGSNIAGIIEDGAGIIQLEKTGTGRWTLRGNNTFSGGVVISQGTLAITSATALGTGPLTFNGGTIENGSASALTHSGVFDKIINSGFTYNSANNLTLGNPSTGTATIKFNNSVAITVTGSTRLMLTGHHIDGDSHVLTKEGSGALTLGGTNTGASNTSAKLGGVRVNEGTLTFLKSGTAPNDHDLGVTHVATGATLILATNNNSNATMFTTSGLTGEGTITTLTDQTTGVAQRNLRVGNQNATSTFSGTITNPTSEDGILALTKIGTGTQVLSGNNTYTGATTVSAGTLQIGLAGIGSLGSGTTVTVNNATANLAGTGTIHGATTINNGFLRPGDSSGSLTGTITMSQLALNTGGTAILQIEGNDANSMDRINILSADGFTLNGKIIVSTNLLAGTSDFDTTFAIGNSFNLMDWSGSVAGSFDVGTMRRDGSTDNGSQFDLPDISALNRLWDVSQFLDTGVISVVAVPEPSKAILLLLGVLTILHSQQRRR